MSREPVRWTNNSQPQTLQIAVFLLYATAVFTLVFSLAQGAVPGIFLVAVVAAGVAAGLGVANEKKWGYWLGVVVAFLPFALRLWFGGVDAVLGNSLINLMFEVALVALLLHPQSREYQRVWFK